MGRYRELFGEWVQTHLLITKIVAAIALLVSLSFIIGGAVLISQNRGSWKPDWETFDEMVERQRYVSLSRGFIVQFV